MNDSSQGNAAPVSTEPGPWTRAIIRALWTRLFDADPANPIYLPRII